MIVRGFHFRGNEIVGTYTILDPYIADTLPIQRPVEPGDELYEIDDTLTMAEWHGITDMPANWTADEIKALSPAIRHVIIPRNLPHAGEDEEIIVRHDGRKGPSQVVARKQPVLPVEGVMGGILKARLRGEVMEDHRHIPHRLLTDLSKKEDP